MKSPPPQAAPKRISPKSPSEPPGPSARLGLLARDSVRPSVALRLARPNSVPRVPPGKKTTVPTVRALLPQREPAKPGPPPASPMGTDRPRARTAPSLLAAAPTVQSPLAGPTVRNQPVSVPMARSPQATAPTAQNRQVSVLMARNRQAEPLAQSPLGATLPSQRGASPAAAASVRPSSGPPLPLVARHPSMTLKIGSPSA